MEAEAGDQPIPVWSRWLKWSLALGGVILSYVFLYPILVFALFGSGRFGPSMGDRLDRIIHHSIGPLIWMYGRLSWYESYLDWLSRF